MHTILASLHQCLLSGWSALRDLCWAHEGGRAAGRVQIRSEKSCRLQLHQADQTLERSCKSVDRWQLACTTGRYRAGAR